MPIEIEATYRVVTPMFCGGADSDRAELRAPSFKGVLRFWWRALAWSRLDGNLKSIQREEDALFGSASGGRARASITLAAAIEPKQLRRGEVLKEDGKVVGEGVRYLGYGLMEAFNRRDKRAGELARACLCEPFDFTVHVRTRCLTDDQMQFLRDALIAVGLFGGMGARSRKGYGSMAMRSLRSPGREPWRAPRSLDDLCMKIREMTRTDSPTVLPTFTALSPNARYLLVKGRAERPLQLLDLIGQEIKNAIRAVPPKERAVFGLPRKPRSERRASPLFIHIDECAGKPVAALSFLPAQFLPDGSAGSSGRGTRVRQAADLYGPVQAFLDRLKERLQAEEVRP